MAELVSTLSGFVLFLLCLMVMKVYWPSKKDVNNSAKFLKWAIFFGFLAHAINTVWWQLIVNVVVHLDIMSYSVTRSIGLYFDGFLKGLASASAIMHLLAVHSELNAEEKKEYKWYDMPWYPEKVRMITFFSKGSK